MALRPVFDGDAGWHLAVGRLIAESGIPRTNALSWTAPDHPWYATAWLFDLAAFELSRPLGALGIQLIVLLLLAAAFVAWAIALRLADPEVGPWLLPAGALLLVPRITHRPHVATWAALAIITSLGLAGRGRRPAWRWAMVPVLALFGNLHPGVGFAVGVAGLFCLEEFFRTRRPVELLAAAACALALLVNPGALFNLGYLLDNLRVQSVISVVEFLPGSFDLVPALWVLTPLALASAWYARRRVGWALGASFAALAAFGFRSNRVGSDAYICALPLLAAGLSLLEKRLGPRLPAILAILLTAGVAALHRFDSWLPPRFGASWNSGRVPVRAAEFVREAGLSGKRFNGYADGGYLEWALPEQPAFADARVQAYPDFFWRDFQQAEKSGRAFRAWMDALGVEWAVATRVRERLGGLGLFNSPDWALVHWDPITEVWVARKIARLKPVIDKYEYRHFRPYGSIVAQLDKVPRDQIEAFAAEIDRYQRLSPEDPFAQLVRCGLATRAGSAAAPVICEAARATGHSSVLALLPKARAVSRAP